MLRLTLKNIWAHKMRLLLSMLSIFLGVAFLSGTLVFTSTIEKSFNDLFTSVYKKTDAIVRVQKEEGSEFDENKKVGTVPKSVLADIQAIPDIAEAEGSIDNYNVGALVVIDKEGKRIFPLQGPPTFGAAISKSEVLSPWLYVGEKGQNLTPAETAKIELADNEILVDKSTADAQDFKVGSKVKIVTDTDIREYTIKGFMRFGTADGFGRTANFFFNEKQAGEIFNQVDEYSAISIDAKPGVSQDAVTKEIKKVLAAKYGDKYEVKTGEELIKESQKVVETIFNFFTIFLLVFAAISFLVALIIIINSFAIIMTQRKREYALLRAIGATGSQIRRSVLGESILVGLIASTFGVAGGIGLALGIKELLKAINFKLPAGDLVIPNSSIIIGILVGTLATFISAFIPALSASRIPPIEALRESAYEKNKRMKYRIIFAAILAVLSMVIIYSGYNKAKTDSGEGLKVIGTGIALLLLFVVIALPVFIKPFTKIVGSKAAGVLLILFGGRRAFGITGEIARRNNYRNPRRSAKTSLALMIGVALVAFITVFASSTAASFTSYLKQTYSADIIVGNFGGSIGGQLSAQRCAEIDKQTYIKYSTCVGTSAVEYTNSPGSFESKVAIVVDTENLTKLFTVKYQGKVEKLNAGEVIISKDIAEDDSVKIGSSIELQGQKASSSFKVVGILEESILGPGGNAIVIDNKSLDAIDTPEPASLSMLVVKDGVNAREVKGKLDTLLKNTGIEVNDLETLRKQQEDSLNNVLGFVYGLLALAIIIAAIGILNTMSLSILERRRELGLMRAVGTTKAQVRGFVRFESVILAVLGTVVGIIFGIGSGYLLIKSLKEEGFTSFSVNPTSMIVIVFLSALLGSTAGAWPAWRATKVDVLKAISVE